MANQQHAILVPLPLQGHVTPFINLALTLASKGFTITFLNTQSLHHQMFKAQNSLDNTSQDIFSKARNSGYDIRYVTVSDGFPLSFDRMANEDQYWEGILHVFPVHVDELVGKVVYSSKPRVTCLISDTFYVWGSSISKKYGLVYCSFWTQPVTVFALYYHWDLLWENGHFGSKENRKDGITYIPGVSEIKPTDLMSFLQDTETLSTVCHRIIYKAFKDVRKADFILSNTIQELEHEASTSLQSKQIFYSIGPVSESSNLANISVMKSLWHESNCSHWLDTKQHGSVLYVSFGSYAHVNKEIVTEIANGLVLSNVSFLWVVRAGLVSSDDRSDDVLPNGFIEDVKKQGLIVQWCTQMDVLSHPAIGGFLTHCGWNSILEGIKCNVPMLCYPLLSDQFTNRKLVVDDWRIGIDLWCEKPITREKVSTKIKILMSEKVGNELRLQIRKYRDMMENATSASGSSSLNLDQFIKQLCQVK